MNYTLKTLDKVQYMETVIMRNCLKKKSSIQIVFSE